MMRGMDIRSAGLTLPSKQKFLVFFLSAAVLVGLMAVIYRLNGIGFEWGLVYRRAALELLAGRSPYTIGLFLNPPWLLLPLIPLALLPEKVGAAVLSVLGLAAFSFLGFKRGARPLTLILLILSYPVGLCLYRGQIDWLVLLGVLFPPQYGLFLVTAKPQLGIGIAVFWLVEAWRMGGLRQVLIVFAPVTAAYLLSFAIFGFWPLQNTYNSGDPFQVSIWPLSIPIGLVVLVQAVRSRNLGLAIVASPFFSPYVQAYSWAGALFGLLPLQVETLLAVAGVWAWQLLRMFPLR